MVDTPEEALDWAPAPYADTVGPLAAYLRWRWDLHFWWPVVTRLVGKGGAAVDVGTWKGRKAQRLLESGFSVVFCVNRYRPRHDGRREPERPAFEEAQAEASWRLIRERQEGRAVFVEEEPVAAAEAWDRDQVALVHIGGDPSYEDRLAAMIAWWPRILPGCWLALDDHLPGRWWGTDVLDAARDFQPWDESGRVKIGRWLCIQKLAP